VNRFFAAAFRQRRALLALLAALAVVGVALGMRLPAAILPEIAFPRITVIADSGERPAEDMVRAVTRPLEAELRRVPEVREIRSVTSRGSTEIQLDCAWRVPMQAVLQKVQAAVEATRGDLPDGTDVEARLMSPAIMPVLGMSLTSDKRSSAELRDLALLRLQPELARLPGVAEVVIQGGQVLEARVALDPYKLEARNLDATRVADAIRASGGLASVGLLETNGQLYLGLADARALGVPAIAAIPVPLEGGASATLGELGKVSIEPAPQFTRYRANGRDAVLVNFLRKPTGSTVGLSQAAHEWFATHKNALPADVHVETWYDQADLVSSSVGGVRDALLIGAFFSILVVLLFLRSVRLGLTAALVLPGSIALTLLGLVATGQTLNMMTLGGIAAAVGLVLDDAIVVIEHLAHRASEGMPVRDAMVEIAPTLIGSSACTLAIFVPFMALGGLTGAFFRVLALSIAFMLTASLAICLIYVSWIPLGKKHDERPGRVDRLHQRALESVRGRRWLAFLVPLALVLVLWPLSRTLGTGFLPEMDEGSLILDYVAPPGSSAAETDRILRLIEHEIDTVPEIVTWSRRTATSSASLSPSRTWATTCFRLARSAAGTPRKSPRTCARRSPRSSPRSRSSSAS
jgi:multidrug efflux pump subunit AcrB